MTRIGQPRDAIFGLDDLKIVLRDALGGIVPVIHGQPYAGSQSLQRGPITHQRPVGEGGRRQFDQHRAGIDGNQLQINGAPADGPANAVFKGEGFTGKRPTGWLKWL